MAEQNEGQNFISKVVKMPPAQEMLEKLKACGLYGETPQTDAFYKRFVESVADSEKVGGGLNMAWELASYDTLRDYPPMITNLVGMGFNRAIDAVTPDPEVAKQAKEFRAQVLEKLEKSK